MFAALLLAAATAVPPCSGGLYSVRLEGDSHEAPYQVAKVLAVEPPLLYVRFYRNRFRTRPQKVDPAQLEMGRVGDPEGAGTRCLAIYESLWLREAAPKHLAFADVTDEERESADEQRSVNGKRPLDPERERTCKALRERAR